LKRPKRLNFTIDTRLLVVVDKDEDSHGVGHRVSWFANSLEGVLEHDGAQILLKCRRTLKKSMEEVQECFGRAVIASALQICSMLEDVDDPI
jgi:hypothetical protein